MARKLESPEEHGAGKRPKRGGEAVRREGGFSDGEMGRGPTPYKKSHSGGMAGGQSRSAHMSASGRGGSGIYGAHEQNKRHAKDVEHPASHAEFEALGGDDGYGTGGKD